MYMMIEFFVRRASAGTKCVMRPPPWRGEYSASGVPRLDGSHRRRGRTRAVLPGRPFDRAEQCSDPRWSQDLSLKLLSSAGESPNDDTVDAHGVAHRTVQYSL